MYIPNQSLKDEDMLSSSVTLSVTFSATLSVPWMVLSSGGVNVSIMSLSYFAHQQVQFLGKPLLSADSLRMAWIIKSSMGIHIEFWKLRHSFLIFPSADFNFNPWQNVTASLLSLILALTFSNMLPSLCCRRFFIPW